MTVRFHSRGLVLATNPSGDSSLVCHILTPDHGLIHCFARNARSVKRRFSSGIEVCDLGRIEFTTRSSGLSNLYEFISESSFPALRTSLDRFTAAAFLCEVSDRLLKESAPDTEAAFELLVAALTTLSEVEEQNEILKTAYKSAAYLLKLSGFESSFIEKSPGTGQFLKLMSHIEQIFSSPLRTRGSIEASIRYFARANRTV